MIIDLSLLHSQTVDKIDITSIYDIPKEYFEKSSVLELKNIKVNGIISLDNAEDEYTWEDHISCTIEGTMILEDSISLEPVEYPFLIEYDDIIDKNCKNNENSLDIFAFLWENIVLEVPLQFTKVKDLSKFHGDGWRLISEDELVKTNNPFKDLITNQEKE